MGQTKLLILCRYRNKSGKMYEVFFYIKKKIRNKINIDAGYLRTVHTLLHLYFILRSTYIYQ